MHDFQKPVTRDWDFPRAIAGVGVLVRFAAENGVAAADVLAGSGVSSAQLTDPASEVAAHQELRVVRNLSRLLPGAGISVGSRYHATTFGILGYAFLSCATMREAVNVALRYLDLSFAFTSPVALLAGDRVRVVLDDTTVPRDVAAFLLERDLAAIHTVVNDVLPDGVPALAVEFCHGDAADSGAYERVFGVRPVFGAPRTCLTYDTTVFDRALPLASPETVALCEDHCRSLATRRRDRDGITTSIRRHLQESDAFDLGMDEVARRLCMSSRTLRRRLAALGTSYQEVLDEVRADQAARLLADRANSVDQVAARLGYAETSSFIHAFRRWHGTTPGAYAARR